MDKKWMLEQTQIRRAELERVYLAAQLGKTVDGRTLSPSGAGSKRSHTKKDIQLLVLLEQLLQHCSDFEIDDADAEQGFDKLVEPRSAYYGRMYEQAAAPEPLRQYIEDSRFDMDKLPSPEETMY